MKFILVGIVILGMGYIGFGLSKYYRKRKRFFEDLILLCEKLCVDISFSNETLSNIISSNLSFFSKEFVDVLNCYLNYLKNNEITISSDLIFKNNTLIKEDEKEAILIFFRSLGRLDASNQVAEIKGFKSKFLDFKNVAEEDNKKFGTLSLKLMVLLGLLVVIILIWGGAGNGSWNNF